MTAGSCESGALAVYIGSICVVLALVKARFLRNAADAAIFISTFALVGLNMFKKSCGKPVCFVCLSGFSFNKSSVAG